MARAGKIPMLSTATLKNRPIAPYRMGECTAQYGNEPPAEFAVGLGQPMPRRRLCFGGEAWN